MKSIIKNNRIIKGIWLTLILINLNIPLNAQKWSNVTTVTASDASASSYFGSAIAIDGNYAIIRAVGAVYIFKCNRTTGIWSQKQKIIINSSFNFENGSICISGDYIAVVGGSNKIDGSIYLFKRDNITDTWSQQQVLTPSDATGFSGYISMSGNYIVAGAMYESEDEKGTNSLGSAGALYIFELVSGTWIEQQKIVASDRKASAFFGGSVSISGNLIVTCASGYKRVNPTTYHYEYGCVSIIKRDSNTDIWSIKQDIFGNRAETVAVSNKIISANGSIYEENSGGSWVFVKNSYPPLAHFISGNHIIICNEIGFLFEKDSSGKWSELQKFGWCNSVNISGEDLAIGNSSTNSKAGIVDFYKMDPYATVSSSSVNMGSTEGSKATVDLICNSPFTAISNQSWLKVSPESISNVISSDTIPLILTVSANPTSSTRSAKVTISVTGVSNQYIIITQAANTTTANPLLISSKFEISLFPNPVKSELHIKGIEGNTTIHISDLDGKIRILKDIIENCCISTESLPQGIYLVRIITDKGCTEKKIVKE